MDENTTPQSVGPKEMKNDYDTEYMPAPADTRSPEAVASERRVKEAVESGRLARGFALAPTVSMRVRRVCAWLGLVAAIVAWGVYFFNPLAAVVTACVALGLSAAGVSVGRGCLRDLCITALLAEIVLIVVYAIFYWGIDYAVNSL